MGVDLLPNRIRIVRETFLAFTFLEGNAEQLAFPDDWFDLVERCHQSKRSSTCFGCAADASVACQKTFKPPALFSLRLVLSEGSRDEADGVGRIEALPIYEYRK